jgi:hypothetical protein
MSNTPIVFTDFSRFFYDYINHTQRFDGFQQVVPGQYQVEAMDMFDSHEKTS